MTQQNTYQPAVLAAIDGEISAVQSEYKAALAAVGARLEAAQLRSRDAETSRTDHVGRVLVAEALPELEPELAIALHKFEARLDQLKELRDWIKIDPELTRFVARCTPAQAAASFSAQAFATVPPTGPVSPVTSSPRQRGVPVLMVTVVALVALAIGWLISIALPAATLLPR
jgi:hypothetical protein